MKVRSGDLQRRRRGTLAEELKVGPQTKVRDHAELTSDDLQACEKTNILRSKTNIWEDQFDSYQFIGIPMALMLPHWERLAQGHR